MKKALFAMALVAIPALAAPAVAQSYQDSQRWIAAQQRFRDETARFQAEADHYTAAARQGGGPGYPPPGGYQQGGYGGGGYAQGDYDDDQFTTDYDASRYYRTGPNYQERRLSANDQVYRGSDNRYYCRRSDGTTGLIVGAAGGGVLGNVIDGGHHRAAGTLLGGALGAILGKSVDQSNVRCR